MFRPANLILSIAVILVIICAALFVVTSVALHSFNLAWDVARGAASPFGLNSWLAVILSVVGYLLVPVLIGLMVTESLTRFVERRCNQRRPCRPTLRVILHRVHVTQRLLAGRVARTMDPVIPVAAHDVEAYRS